MNTIMLSQIAVGEIFIWTWIKQALGWIMEGCYRFFSIFVDESKGEYVSLAACIILFTVVIYSLLLPLQIKNAKFQKLNSVMNPEIQAISKKYKNKTDNESRMKQQEELNAVYEKYGVSPTGGCLQSFIQLPILFAVYRVLYDVPNYVKSISNLFNGLVEKVVGVKGYQETIFNMAKESDNTLLTSAINKLSDATAVNESVLPNLFYQFRSTDWNGFTEKFSTISDTIESTRGVLDKVNGFFGVNIADTPKLIISNNWDAKNYGAVAIAVLIPVLSGFFQWLSSKIVQQPANNNSNQGDTAAAINSSMKTMLVIMPIFSVWICYTLPLGIGLYWTVSAVYRVVSQIFINKRMKNISVEKLIEKNQEKINKKRAKKGLPPKQVKSGAQINTKNIKTNSTVSTNKSVEDIKKTAGSGNKSYSSIRDKAFMVSDYNDRNNKKK